MAFKSDWDTEVSASTHCNMLNLLRLTGERKRPRFRVPGDISLNEVKTSASYC